MFWSFASYFYGEGDWSAGLLPRRGFEQRLVDNGCFDVGGLVRRRVFSQSASNMK